MKLLTAIVLLTLCSTGDIEVVPGELVCAWNVVWVDGEMLIEDGKKVRCVTGL